MQEGAREREWLLSRVVLALGLIGLPLAGLFPVANADAFGHLAQGRQIFELGYVPKLDRFSIATPTPQPWHNYEWLSDLGSYAIYRAFGADGLLLAKCAWLAATVLLLYAVARRICLGATRPTDQRAGALCACLLVAAIPAVRFRLTERPHLVALPLLAFLLLGLLRLADDEQALSRRQRLQWLLALFVAQVLWVNLHGSHLLGLAASSCFVLAACLKREDHALALPFAGVLGVQVLASCISPYGPAIVLDALAHVLDPRYRELVSEWRPWQLGDPTFLLAAPLVHTGLLLWAARRLAKASVAGRALALLSLVLCLAWARSIRFTAEYMLLTAPMIAAVIAHALAHTSSVRFAAVLAPLALGSAIFAPLVAAQLPPMLPIATGVSLREQPSATASWLTANLPSARILASTNDAWFLMFGVKRARFAIDGRIPFYGAEHVQRVQLAFASPAHLHALIAELGVDTLVLRLAHLDHALAHRAVRADPHFGLAVIENDHVTYVKRDARLRSGKPLVPLELEPSYDPGWLLAGEPSERPAIERQLARLPDEPGSDGYRAWVNGMLELRPLLRAGGRSGLEHDANTRAQAQLERVAAALRVAAEGAQSVPVVHAYRAIVQIARCELEDAERSLALASREGESRDTLLPRQELLLRRGEHAAVQAFLQSATQVPELASDPWIVALRAELATAVPCANE